MSAISRTWGKAGSPEALPIAPRIRVFDDFRMSASSVAPSSMGAAARNSSTIKRWIVSLNSIPRSRFITRESGV